jgi:hypothetical protein
MGLEWCVDGTRWRHRPLPSALGAFTWPRRTLLAGASASNLLSCQTCVIAVAKPAGSCSSMRFCEQGEYVGHTQGHLQFNYCLSQLNSAMY